MGDANATWGTPQIVTGNREGGFFIMIGREGGDPPESLRSMDAG